jgi:hypothetical protein
VEDVRAVLVAQDAVLVEPVVRVAGDVGPAVDHQHAQVVLFGDPSSADRSGEAGADDENIPGFHARVIGSAGASLSAGHGHAGVSRTSGCLSAKRS